MGTEKNRPWKDGDRDAGSLREKYGASRNFISDLWSLEQ